MEMEIPSRAGTTLGDKPDPGGLSGGAVGGACSVTGNAVGVTRN